MAFRLRKTRPKVGVALSGGATRGFAHIGALKVLHENQIPIDLIVGTSIGSIIGAAYASGCSFEEMTEVATHLRWRDVYRIAFSKMGLASNEAMNQILSRLVKVNSFEALKVPLHVVTTDIRTGRAVVIGSGELKTALRASCAIPALYVPVTYQGLQLVDGGLVGNLPVEFVKSLGGQRIIALDATSTVNLARAPTQMLDIIMQSLVILGQQNCRRSGAKADVWIRPRLEGVGWGDFQRAREVIRAGEDAARPFIATIRSWVGEEKPTFLQRLRAWWTPRTKASPTGS